MWFLFFGREGGGTGVALAVFCFILFLMMYLTICL